MYKYGITISHYLVNCHLVVTELQFKEQSNNTTQVNILTFI